MRRLRLYPAVLLALFLVYGKASASSVWVTSVAHDCATAPDDTVIVDVMLNNSQSPIDDGVLFVSHWDPDLLFVSAARGDLLAGWTGFSFTTELGDQARIEISNVTPIPAGSSGQMVRLKYLFNCCSGPYNSPHNEPITVSGTGDFTTTSFVGGQSVCMMAKPGTVSVASGYATCDSVSVTVKVPVMLMQSAVPVDDGGIQVLVSGYYGGQLTYAGYERGNLTANWDTFDVVGSVNGATSTATITGSNATAIPAGTSGVLANLLFTAQCCAGAQSPVGHTEITLQLPTGDLTSFALESGDWYCMTVATKPATWGHVKSLYRQ